MSNASTRVPRQVWTLGLLTLVPFYTAAGVYCYGPEAMRRTALMALLVWSTAMLSYLGGVRAGMELARDTAPRWTSLSLSLGTPLLAFGLLFGAGTGRFDTAWEVSGFLTAFLLVWLRDVRDPDGPLWRPRYRTLITAGAAIALAFALEQALSM